MTGMKSGTITNYCLMGSIFMF